MTMQLQMLPLAPSTLSEADSPPILLDFRAFFLTQFIVVAGLLVKAGFRDTTDVDEMRSAPAEFAAGDVQQQIQNIMTEVSWLRCGVMLLTYSE